MNEDKLILYYYDDGLSARERQEIEAALGEDAGLAARYADLCRDLDGFDDGPVDVPSHVVQRMHDSIDRMARPVLVSQQPRRSFSPLSFVWGAAVTAALAIGIGIGVYLSTPPAAIPVQVAGDPFTRGMQVYLQDARADLVSMPVSDVAERAELIMHIVEQNRLFERAAVQNDAQGLARVLRAFEPILLQLATEDLPSEQAEALRAQLAFELNVMLTKLSRVSSNETQTT